MAVMSAPQQCSWWKSLVSDVKLICLDMEGVLTPEIWIELAERSGVDELRRTTRDEPDYDALMKYRIDVLDRHGLGMPALKPVIDSLDPLPGALEFLDELRSRHQVVILSDTFREFVGPLMAKLGRPTLFCHQLLIGENGRISGYRQRMPDHKRAAVMAFQGLSFTVYAAGDSYNDTRMLAAADAGFLFRPPPGLIEEFPEFPVLSEYSDMLEAFAAPAPREEPRQRRLGGM